MKTRTAQDIRRDLHDARRRLYELYRRGDDAMSSHDLMMGYDAASAILLVRNHVTYYEHELREATKHGEQLAFSF